MSGSALFVLIAAFLGALGLALWQGFAPAELLTWAAGGAALIWLIVLVTLPWNLHLRAREVLADLQRSRASGIAVTDDQLAFAARVKRWTLFTSLGIHLLSAAVALLLAIFGGQALGYPFAGFYLLSSVVRPASAAIQQVRRRLETIADDARFPRDDVIKLRGMVAAHEEATKRLTDDLEGLRRQHEALTALVEAQRAAFDQKLIALTRKFEESLERLTDNRELIAGIKAFLRMVREGGA